MEQGKKRRVCDILKWPTKKQATQIEIDPQAIVEAPAVLFPKHGWPKVNQHKEAEIRMKQDEIMSRLFAMHGFQANPMDVVDKDVPAGEEF